MRSLALCAVSVLAGGCFFSSYLPGEITTDPRTGARYPNTRTFGCVDVMVLPETWAETPAGGQMFVIELGNRCDRGVPTRFPALRVSLWREASSDALAADAYDPRGELRAAILPPHARIQERIAFVPWDRRPEIPFRRACIDLEDLVPAARGDTRRCFAPRGSQWLMDE